MFFTCNILEQRQTLDVTSERFFFCYLLKLFLIFLNLLNSFIEKKKTYLYLSKTDLFSLATFSYLK